MIEREEIDLNCDSEIVLAECDCEMSLPGYSIVASTIDNRVRLVKKAA
jgi:hypothetical protein